MDKQTYLIRSAEIAQNAAEFVRRIAPDKDRPMMVVIKPATRSLEANSKIHAMFADVARQKEYAGRKLSPEQWKVLFISGHAIATKEGADMLPGLENEFVNLRESSAQMSVKRMASLIEYISAWGADNGIRWSA